MKAQLTRFLIAAAAMAIAGLAFMKIDGWGGWAKAAVALIAGWSIAEAAFHRLADQDTRRADLEDRGRSSSL